jgi:molybdopterin/thiamine biosynthesis adenylyltransferase
VIGTGGLGSTMLFCLAGAGVGTIGFMDGDTVSLSNLYRQFLHFERDVGRKKVDSALEKLKAYNTTLQYVPICDVITQENADAYIQNYDVVLLAVDTSAPRFIINDACCRQGKPLVNGGVDGMMGMLNFVIPGRSPCLRCIYKDPVSSDRRPESFAPIVSAISALEAQLALLVLLGQPPLPFDRVMLLSGTDLTWHTEKVVRDPNCAACGR